MCRLFAMISIEKISPYPYVFKSLYSIKEQSEKEGHIDGWGAYFYTESKLTNLIRSTIPLLDSLELAQEFTKNIKSNISGFFIRKASNPLKLPIEKLLTVDATQPFTYSNITFMHNGSINAPDKILEELKDFKMYPRSYNDSEVYFIIFLKFLEELKDETKAFFATEEFISKIYRKINPDSDKNAYSSLNTIYSNGKKIVAFNKYTNKVKKSLSDQDREYYKMCFKITENELIIASEPLDNSNDWKDIGDSKILEAFIDEGIIKYNLK